MNEFQTILADIFDRGAEVRLTQDEERETIHAAKAGDEAAKIKLAYAYAPALRNAVTRYTDVLGQEDARMAAVIALLDSVATFDPDRYDRLAAVIAPALTNELGEQVASSAAVTVPHRTRTRFFGILRRADGDVHKAALLAPKYEMSRETFYAVLEAINAESMDAQHGERDEFGGYERPAFPLWNPEDVYADAEDRILVEMAFGSVDDLETDICRLSYGFSSYNPVPDGQIAADLGMTRPTVQRRRAGALAKMRDSLGA